MFLNAGMLFGRAKAAFNRLEESGRGPRESGPRDSLESVVFSVAALEGLMNELAEIASYPGIGGEQKPEAINTFASLLREAERGRGTLILKIQLGVLALTGHSPSTGEMPLQDAALLIEVRNSLLHNRSQETFDTDEHGVLRFNPGRIIEKLRSKNVTAIFGEDGNEPRQLIVDWLTRISTIAMAEWACGTASSTAFLVLNALPEWSWKQSIELAYRGPFTFRS